MTKQVLEPGTVDPYIHSSSSSFQSETRVTRVANSFYLKENIIIERKIRLWDNPHFINLSHLKERVNKRPIDSMNSVNPNLINNNLPINRFSY